MPIGFHIRDDLPFTNHVIDIQPGDSIYLFSDGYADQFGGPDGKKLKYKPFKEILLNNHQLAMQDQKKILDEKFMEWKGELPQIDDVVVIGFRL